MQDRQVDIQSLLPRLVSLVLRRGAPPPLPHTPNQQDTNPPNTRPAGSGLATMEQLGVRCLAVLSLLHHPSIPRRLLGAVHFHRTRLQGRQQQSLSGGAPAPSSSGVATPPPAAGSRGGAIPAPSPPPSTPPPPSRTAAPPTPGASKAAEGLGGAASSAPGDRPTSGAPGTSSPHPGHGAECPSLQSRDGWGGGSVGAGRATSRPYRRGPSC